MAPLRRWFKSLSTQNPRRHERHETPPLIAYFWDGGQPVAHTIKDISPTGFYLCTSERWLPGTLLTVTLRRTYSDSDRPECSVIVMSKVVRYGEDGVGFAFIPVDAARTGQQSISTHGVADRKALDRFIRLLREDAGYIHLGPALALLFIAAAAALSSEAILCLIAGPFVWAVAQVTATARMSGKRKKPLPVAGQM